MALTTLRRRMLEDLPRRGLAPTPQACSVAAVHQLAPHDRRAPDPLSEEDLRQSCLSLLNDQQVAESPCRLHLYGIRCFSARPLQRPWPLFALTRPRHRQALPGVLRPQAVRSLLAAVTRPTAQRCLRMI
jgi:hypothetical protein